MGKKVLPFLLLLPAVLAVGAFAARSDSPLPARAEGPKDAPIVIDVFSDFQCPACKQLYESTLTRVVEDYCAKGKVLLVHHDFPLVQIHAHTMEAARWADAAAIIGKYEAVAAALFAKQEEWAAHGNVEQVVADALGPAEFAKAKKALADHKDQIDSEIQQDVFLGHQMNVTQTPTTKISQKGNVLSVTTGHIQYSILKRYLDDQLAK